MTRMLRQGVAAGAAGGLALGLVLLALGEGTIGRAVALEPAEPGAEEMFSRGVQQLGGVAGAVVYGVAVGVILAVVFARLHRGATDPRSALLLTGAGGIALSVVPFVLYPPNPPGVGDPATIGSRTGAYVLAMAWSVVALVAAARLWRYLRGRAVAEAAALLSSLGLYAGLVAVAGVVLPDRPKAGTGVPAELLWDFRLASLLGAVAFWCVTGAVFASLVGRRGRVPVAEAVGA